MADSVASIRSLYSGKGEFSDGDFEAMSGMSSMANNPADSSNGAGFPLSSSSDFRKFQDNFAVLGQTQGPVQGITDPVSHHYGDEKADDISNTQNRHIYQPNKLLRVASPGTSEWYDNNISSTNVSISSSISEQHSGTKPSSDFAYPEFDYGPGETYSRPLSRNSTTSGFSTTATKDGVEGKRPYKTIPKSLFENILSAKTSKNPAIFQNQTTEHTIPLSLNVPSLGSNVPEFHRTSSPESERGPKLVVPALPPITIDEKIKLMDSENFQ